MTNEMVQEAVLDSLDQLETSQMFAECDVLCALADTYVKSVQIMTESKNELEFDGIVIQEADGGDAAESGEKKKGGKAKEFLNKAKELPAKLLQWIKDAVTAVANFLQRKIGALVIRNVKISFSDTQKVAALKAAGCTFEKESKDAAEGIIRWPTTNFEGIVDTIRQNEEDLASDDPRTFYKATKRMFTAIKKILKQTTTTSGAAPFDGASDCIKYMKKVAKECDRHSKALIASQKAGLANDLASGRTNLNADNDSVSTTHADHNVMDKKYKAAADNIDDLRAAASMARELLQEVTNCTQKTLDAYKVYKQGMRSANKAAKDEAKAAKKQAAGAEPAGATA